jgi:hypothetical protein
MTHNKPLFKTGYDMAEKQKQSVLLEAMLNDNKS